MLKKIFALSAFAACVAVMVGCDKAASVAGSAGSAAKEKTADAVAKAKEEFTKNIDLAKVEEKIGTLSGDAKTTATAKLTEFKKLWDEFKAAPMDKVKELGEKLTAAFADLKKSAGM